MKKNLFFLMLPIFGFGQLFSLDNNYILFSDNYTVSNFSANTYLNTLSDINISYQIVVDSMPLGWDFQNCFPVCNPINTYSSDPLSFPADTSVYLNGHFYPNNIPGEGLLKMELSANHGSQIDTVIWRGEAITESYISQDFDLKKNIKNIKDINGKNVKEFKSGSIFIVTFSDNTKKTYYIIQ